MTRVRRSVAGFTARAGRCLGRREQRTYRMVIAGIDSINVPLGTVPGVFTLLVPALPSDRTLFDRG